MKRLFLFALTFIFILLFKVDYVLAQSDGLTRGCSLPYTRYESENATLGGGAILQQALTFDQSLIASEASNQQYVSLPSNGSYVQWTTTAAAQGFNMRFTMPDNSSGTGQTGSLSIYVNGAKVQDASISSHWAYQYFPSADPVQTPGGKTFMRFDEVHFKLASVIPLGASIKIQKDNGDALTYGVDFIELEPVPTALAAPVNSLSVTSYGAIADDSNDDLAAFNSCIAAAATQGKAVYIPAGKFILSDRINLNVSNMKIQGAGIWYTQLFFSTDLQFSGGILARASGVEISDFTLGTANIDRLSYGKSSPKYPTVAGDMYKIYKGFMGTYGANSKIHDVWVEHFECGAWIAGYDAPYPIDVTTNLIISNSRFRNNYADGINFCQGTNNSTVTNCSIRNEGDDGLAMWANNAMSAPTETNNIFIYNTIENTWRAGGIAIFGGSGHQIHHNIVKDGVGGSGYRATNDFSGWTFDNAGAIIKVFENSFINCGTSKDLWDAKRGAIEIYANTGVFNMRFDNNNIINAQRDGVQLYGTNIDLTFNNTTIDGTGKDGTARNTASDVYPGFGIIAQCGSNQATFNFLTVLNSASGTSLNRNAAFKLNITNASVPVSSVSITPTTTTSLTVGQTSQLTAVLVPSDATNLNVTWKTSNSSVATVDATGLVKAIGVGTADITVTTADGSKIATKSVTVAAAVNITATDESAGEGGNVGVFSISATGITSNVTVSYSVSGTATSGDYTPALGGTVTLTSAAPTATVTITPVDDSNFEGPETLTLTLVAGTGYNLGGNTSATISIADNENPPCTGSNIVHTNSDLTIDGTVDAAWANAPEVTIANATIGTLPSDYAGKYKVLWNSTYLYFFVDVNDASKLNDSGTSWWEDDVIELFIDGDNSKGSSYDGVNDFQLGFRWNDAAISLGGSSVTRTTGIVKSMVATANGYALEVAIPWTTIGVTPTIGNKLGIEVEVDDDDNGGTRDTQSGAFSTTTTAWSTPSVFGTGFITSSSPLTQVKEYS